MSDKPENIENNIPPAEEEHPQKTSFPPHKEYIKRILKYKNFYLTLLYCSAILVVISILLALYINVLIGASLAIVTAVFYFTVNSAQMFHLIGCKYKSIEGGMKFTLCEARYGKVLWLPSRLIGFDLIEIDDKAFSSPKNHDLEKVFFPKTLKKIGKDIFDDATSISEIYFEGTEEEWNNIEKSTDFSPYTIVFEAKYPSISKKKKRISKSNLKPEA